MHVVFIDAQGAQTSAQLSAPGTSIMRTAQLNGVRGIIGECGGNLTCATCHAYVDEDWLPIVPEPGAFELSMLEVVALRQKNSRLTCQIKMNEALDGIRIILPSSQ